MVAINEVNMRGGLIGFRCIRRSWRTIIYIPNNAEFFCVCGNVMVIVYYLL